MPQLAAASSNAPLFSASHRYELDYAYWPINGDAWVNATQEWDNEDYGILDRDYVNVRRPGQLAGLQKLTW